MYIIFLIVMSITQTSIAMTTMPMHKKLQPPSLTEELNTRFGNQTIQLTNEEYRQLGKLPPLDSYIASDRTVKIKELLNMLLSLYKVSRPQIYCIRAPCPQSTLLIISNDSIRIEINLTDSPFSEIIKSLNIF